MTSKRIKPRGFYLSATCKSSGKTLVGIGLGAAMKRKGLTVQAFKKGPDYIDPMWHRSATGRACYNLDFFTQTPAEIGVCFDQNRQHADVVYIEGNKGLFDGVDTLGSDCNAQLASQLGLPVVLVLNVSGITRGIAPLLFGYERFTNDVSYAGLILNNVAGPRHEEKLLAAIKAYTDFTVLGSVPKSVDLELEERHLGLIPENETNYAHRLIAKAADVIDNSVDLQALMECAAQLDQPKPQAELRVTTQQRINMGIAKDRAFGFYYPDDLLAMQQYGANLSYFDTLQDATLPEVDALFIGGGFPEMQLDGLQRNRKMRAQIKAFIESGKPVYAECGGLMYLCREINYQGKNATMVGAIDATINMTSKPVGRGYARLQVSATHPWFKPLASQSLACHEFHYSTFDQFEKPQHFAFAVRRGFGIDGQGDGIVVHNTLATYCHQRHTKNNPWVSDFIHYIRQTINK